MLDREKIIENGWRQGASLYVKDLPTEQQQHLKKSMIGQGMF